MSQTDDNISTGFNDMLNTVSSIQLPNKINIIKNRSQTGGSNTFIKNNKSDHNINKLLSMLATESATSAGDTVELEHDLRNMLTLKGGKGGPDTSEAPESEADAAKELQQFFKKYNIKTVNGIKSKYFIKNHTGDEAHENDGFQTETDKPDTTVTSPASGPSDASTQSDTSPLPQINMNDSETTPNDSETSPNTTATELSGGARGMNPGFKAFIDLKKTIAEKLGIPNGPKAAKIAGSIQKEMRVKYADLTSVQLAAKGLEHFNKDPSKYKKMV